MAFKSRRTDMNYYVNSFITTDSGFPIVQWNVTDELGRWTHSDRFHSRQSAEVFLDWFLKDYLTGELDRMNAENDELARQWDDIECDCENCEDGYY
jgi:hypothetical protein